MFSSIRWKFIVVYFLLVFIAMVIIGIFIVNRMEDQHRYGELDGKQGGYPEHT
jgi:two-component system sensor histidine kinase VicK